MKSNIKHPCYLQKLFIALQTCEKSCAPCLLVHSLALALTCKQYHSRSTLGLGLGFGFRNCVYVRIPSNSCIIWSAWATHMLFQAKSNNEMRAVRGERTKTSTRTKAQRNVHKPKCIQTNSIIYLN